MIKALVTGANSFIGSNFIEYALEHTDWSFVAVICNNRHRIDDVLSSNEEWKNRVDVISHDLNNPIPKEFAESVEVNYVFNFASQARVAPSIKSPIPLVQNNVNIILNLLEYARVAKPKRLYHLSTTDIFGGSLQPYSEESLPYPNSPYAASKSMQEQLCMAYSQSYDVPITVLNPTNIYGKRQSSENFIPLCVKNIIQDKVISIYGKPTDIGKRSYLHVDVLSRVLIRIVGLEGFKRLPIFERYNLSDSSNDPISNLELALMIAQILDKPVQCKLVVPSKSYNKLCSINSDKIEDLLVVHGLSSNRIFDDHSFRDRLEEVVLWMVENQQWL